ncbi:MAG: hypothetical protein M1516_01735 [Firmicutes bacterium]|nr:hypothetical protein [Bacillota bacterium]
MKTLVVSVDRSDADTVLINTTVGLLHCPIRIGKGALRSLGYNHFRPVELRPIATALVEREVSRRGRIPLGGFRVADDDLEGLPPAPPRPPR